MSVLSARVSRVDVAEGDNSGGPARVNQLRARYNAAFGVRRRGWAASRVKWGPA